MDYGRLKFFPAGKSPNVPDYTKGTTEDTSLVEVFLRGTFENPELWGIFADGTEKQLGGSGFSVVKSAQTGSFAQANYSSLQEYMYVKKCFARGTLVFNKAKFFTGVLGNEMDVVLYDSNGDLIEYVRHTNLNYGWHEITFASNYVLENGQYVYVGFANYTLGANSYMVGGVPSSVDDELIGLDVNGLTEPPSNLAGGVVDNNQFPWIELFS